MTTMDFHEAEARTGAGAGGITPRRLIPSRFRRPATISDSEHWTASPVRVAVVLAVSAATSLALTLAIDRPADHSADRSVVIAPVRPELLQ